MSKLEVGCFPNKKNNGVICKNYSCEITNLDNAVTSHKKFAIIEHF